jgi:hypothetical protein
MNTEQTDKRPKCDWPVPAEPNPAKNGGTRPCGSEERVYNVKGHGRWGWAKKTPVCEKHLPEAWKKWNVDSAEPCTRSPRDVALTTLCQRALTAIDELNR